MPSHPSTNIVPPLIPPTSITIPTNHQHSFQRGWKSGPWRGEEYRQGRLVDPPSRASMWRYGFKNPVEYGDDRVDCGGFVRHWHDNQGKCGVCGDPWDLTPPRPHETRGRYGRGIIVRNYTQAQEVSWVTEVTSAGVGWVEYRLCARQSVWDQETPTCFTHLLQDTEGRTQLPVNVTQRSGQVTHVISLPSDLSCPACVVQWRYVKIGKAGREDYRACADVIINPAPPTTTTTITTITATSLTPPSTPAPPLHTRITPPTTTTTITTSNLTTYTYQNTSYTTIHIVPFRPPHLNTPQPDQTTPSPTHTSITTYTPGHPTPGTGSRPGHDINRSPGHRDKDGRPGEVTNRSPGHQDRDGRPGEDTNRSPGQQNKDGRSRDATDRSPGQQDEENNGVVTSPDPYLMLLLMVIAAAGTSCIGLYLALLVDDV
ncbi:hypothetical protein Pcinc_006717 [Petrolisthes cinctipes]|uniref:Chitin-binding type-4 domain-containing protein n=1 Tax=Petrolisthes cinctipes TaxID=88211 RepID=A0AAE1G9Y6_PETCI|nr:hypothetical protein Pcinc_006717 [Petrolisthes cinctipes]